MACIVYEIDGEHFSTLEGFFQELWPIVAGSPNSGRTNLDALNDVLSWPDQPYELVWKNSALSKVRLGYPEIARKLEMLLQTCHPSNRDDILVRLDRARSAVGPTMFDWLVELIRENEPYLTLQLR